MKRRTFATVILSLAIFAGAASACPMCKDSISNREGEFNELHDSYNTNGQNISGGINASVYVMLATLLGMMGMVSAIVVKGVRGTNVRQRGFPVDRDDRDEHKR